MNCFQMRPVCLFLSSLACCCVCIVFANYPKGNPYAGAYSYQPEIYNKQYPRVINVPVPVPVPVGGGVGYRGGYGGSGGGFLGIFCLIIFCKYI